MRHCSVCKSPAPIGWTRCHECNRRHQAERRRLRIPLKSPLAERIRDLKERRPYLSQRDIARIQKCDQTTVSAALRGFPAAVEAR